MNSYLLWLAGKNDTLSRDAEAIGKTEEAQELALLETFCTFMRDLTENVAKKCAEYEKSPPANGIMPAASPRTGPPAQPPGGPLSSTPAGTSAPKLAALPGLLQGLAMPNPLAGPPPPGFLGNPYAFLPGGVANGVPASMATPVPEHAGSVDQTQDHQVSDLSFVRHHLGTASTYRYFLSVLSPSRLYHLNVLGTGTYNSE